MPARVVLPSLFVIDLWFEFVTSFVDVLLIRSVVRWLIVMSTAFARVVIGSWLTCLINGMRASGTSQVRHRAAARRALLPQAHRCRWCLADRANARYRRGDAVDEAEGWTGRPDEGGRDGR